MMLLAGGTRGGTKRVTSCTISGVPRNYVRGVQRIQLRTEGTEPPGQGFRSICNELNLQYILTTLLRMNFPRNWEFDSALSKLRNFGEEWFEPPQTPILGTPLCAIM
jgi:hypothetical protein